MPYMLTFKDISGYYEECHYCGESRCGGCPVPYSDTATVQQILGKLNLSENNTFFSDNRVSRGKEIILQVTWHHEIFSKLFDYLSTAIPFEKKDQDESMDSQGSADIKLTDCLAEFKQSEILDEENMWYCP